MKSSLSSTFRMTAAGVIFVAASLAHAQAPASQPTTEKSSITTQEGSAQDAQRGNWHGKKHMHKAHRDAALWVPGLGPVSKQTVDALALSPTQAALLKEAQDEQQAIRKAHRETMKQGRLERGQQLQSGQVDPRAVVKSMNERHEQMRADQLKVQEKWLAVWDSLDDKQRQTLSENFRQHAEKRAKRMSDRAASQAS